MTLAEALGQVAAHDGVRMRRLITLPALVRVARSLAAGTNLAGPGAVVGETRVRGLAQRTVTRTEW